jgi:hypothetical protein
MSVVKIVLASLVCLGLSLPAFAGSFEGVVVMKGTSDGDPTTQKTYFKGDKMRIDEQDGNYTVWDAAKKEGYKVDAKTRTVMVIPWRDVKPEDAKKMFEGMTVIKTGKSDKVAGYPCEIYLSKEQDENSTTELCVAKGISNSAIYGFIGGDLSGRGSYPAWFRDLVKDGGFPLRMIDRNESGKEESRSEAIVEAKRLDDALFAAPAGYRKTDMAAMKQQMMEQMQRLHQKNGK